MYVAHEELLHTDHEMMFSVSRERSGDRRYFLDVLCSQSFAMFERRLEMNAEEIEWFLHDPRQFKTLVLQVLHWPHRFTGRLQPP